MPLTDSAKQVLKLVTNRFDVADDEEFVNKLTELLLEVRSDGYDAGFADGEAENGYYYGGYDAGYDDGYSAGYNDAGVDSPGV